MATQSKQARLVLLLVRAQASGKPTSAGFSIAMVLVVVFSALIGVGSLAYRTLSNQAGGSELNASRAARDAAESGTTAIIAELNKVENRRLLVSGSNPGAWGSSNDPLQRNACLSPSIAPLASASTIGSNSWKSVGGNGEYILRSVRYANRDRSRRRVFTYAMAGSGASAGVVDTNFDNDTNSLINLSPVAPGGLPNIGHIEITVEGRIVRNSQTVATATVVKEFEVIPKCCGVSFGEVFNRNTGLPIPNSFGNDQRACRAQGFRGLEELGLVFGFEGGSIAVSGSAGSLLQVNPDGSPGPILPSILCVANSTGGTDCSPYSSLSTAGGPVPILPGIITTPPPPSFEGPASTPSLSITGNTSRNYKIRNDRVEVCTAANCSNNSAWSEVSSCRTVPNSLVARYQCQISQIDPSGNSLIVFDTSGGAIALFFNQPSGTVTLGGRVSLEHRYCASTPSANEVCNTIAPADKFFNLSLFGDQTYNRFDLTGRSEGTSLFVFFRNGGINIAGNNSISGALWSKNLDLKGSFTSATPAIECSSDPNDSSDDNAFCLIRGGTNVTDNGFDWAALRPISTRAY
jgi:hypothetical protein